jgi:hypothetical protein
MTSLAGTSIFDAIADTAVAESPVWGDALLPPERRRPEPVFSPLVPDAALSLGLETIYEGYLHHYGRPRLFAAPDADVTLLLGDYLCAQGLVHVAADGHVGAVGDFAELLSLCAQCRAEQIDGDGAVWAATAARLGAGGLEAARVALRESRDPGPLLAAARETNGADAVGRALQAHARLAG